MERRNTNYIIKNKQNTKNTKTKTEPQQKQQKQQKHLQNKSTTEKNYKGLRHLSLFYIEKHCSFI
jgi:hypothetical protein